MPNSESASFCVQCGHNLSVIVVPVGVTIISYMFLYGAAQVIVVALYYSNITVRMTEGFLPEWGVWIYNFLAVSVSILIGLYLRKLKRFALVLYFINSFLGLCITGVMLGYINPFLQKMYSVMNLTPRIIEQDIMEAYMIVALLFGIVLNGCMIWYMYTKRRLFAK